MRPVIPVTVYQKTYPNNNDEDNYEYSEKLGLGIYLSIAE